MSDPDLPPNRRMVLAALAGSLLTPVLPTLAHGQSRPSLVLQARSRSLRLQPSAETQVWTLSPSSSDSVPRFKQGDEIDVTLENHLPVPVVLNWHGIDGAAYAEPFLTRQAVPAGGKDSFRLPLRRAGTFICDARLLGDGRAIPSGAQPLVVAETLPVDVDREEVLVIADFRLRADGIALAPGVDDQDASRIYTINGKVDLDITAGANERLRLRIINACQRNAIALKIDDHDVWIMAIDSQPAEPFLARNGQLVLVPGTRIDAFVDATRPPGSISAVTLHDGKQARAIARLLTTTDAPRRTMPLPPAVALPSSGLPSKIDLKNALRFDLALNAPSHDWIKPDAMTALIDPAFRARAGRTVVLALANRGASPVAFHLHGHHVRLLDRLDDGWKPFWLDTLMLDAGQTQRVAFLAENAGRWLMEAMALNWPASRLLRWYAVD